MFGIYNTGYGKQALSSILERHYFFSYKLPTARRLVSFFLLRVRGGKSSTRLL
jgi:hypothetical protein